MIIQKCARGGYVVPNVNYMPEDLDDLTDGGPVICLRNLPAIHPTHPTLFIGIGYMRNPMVTFSGAVCVVTTDGPGQTWFKELPETVRTQADAVAWLLAQQWGQELMDTEFTDPYIYWND